MMNKIYLGDCVTGLKKIQSNSVQVVVTSPPYNVGKSYKDYKDNLSYEEYQLFIRKVLKECKRTLKKEGVLFLNISNCRANQFKSFDVAYIAQDLGFKLIDSIIWSKPNPRYYNTDRMLTNAYEFVFMFAKSRHYGFDKYAIGIPAIHSDKLKCRTNVWNISKLNLNQFTAVGHCAMFPVEIPELCIKLCSKKGDLVLDPFMGSGSTAIAAKILDRKYIGFEISEEYVEIANKRLGAVEDETVD